jgi:hypothetical protein
MRWKALKHIYHHNEHRFCHQPRYCDGHLDPAILQLLPGLGAVYGEEFIPSLQPTLYYFTMRY